jgi:hypothetical protein
VSRVHGKDDLCIAAMLRNAARRFGSVVDMAETVVLVRRLFSSVRVLDERMQDLKSKMS